MFSKFLVLAATVACALAQQDTINDNVKLTAGVFNWQPPWARLNPLHTYPCV